MEWTYTTIQHGPRKQMGLSLDEYGLLDLIYRTQTSPLYGKSGWCEHSYDDLAEAIGMTKGGAYQMVTRLFDRGFIEVNPANTKQKKTTQQFFMFAYHTTFVDEDGVIVVQKVNGKDKSVQKVNENVQKVNDERSESERHININTNKENKPLSLANEKIEEIEIPEPTHVWGDNTDTRYETALATLKSYFEKNSFRRREISSEARNTCDENQFDEELTLWLRRYADDFQITQNPVKALTSGRGCFISWLSQSFCRAKYQTNGNDTSTQRNGRVQQQRKNGALPTSEELRRKYGVL